MDPSSVIAEAVLNFIGNVPTTREVKSFAPKALAASIARSAQTKAALTAATLALPPGPLGWVTILPEIIAVWRIQAQMVADIAGVYGKEVFLSREQMIYCLFKHTAAQAVRDLVVRAGERYIVRRVSVRAIEGVARAVGLRWSGRVASKSITRWWPVVGALGVGGYAYFDTRQVAQTALELFEREIEEQPFGDTSIIEHDAGS
jgi:hypothetical protein